MKKYILKTLIVLTVISTLTSILTISYGFTVNDLTGTTTNLGEVENIGGNIIKVLSILGSGISIIALILLGIKYMTGSVEEKAAYKRTLLPYILGAAFVFGASTIAGVLYNMFN